MSFATARALFETNSFSGPRDPNAPSLVQFVSKLPAGQHYIRVLSDPSVGWIVFHTDPATEVVQMRLSARYPAIKSDQNPDGYVPQISPYTNEPEKPTKAVGLFAWLEGAAGETGSFNYLVFNRYSAAKALLDLEWGVEDAGAEDTRELILSVPARGGARSQSPTPYTVLLNARQAPSAYPPELVAKLAELGGKGRVFNPAGYFDGTPIIPFAQARPDLPAISPTGSPKATALAATAQALVAPAQALAVPALAAPAQAPVNQQDYKQLLKGLAALGNLPNAVTATLATPHLQDGILTRSGYAKSAVEVAINCAALALGRKSNPSATAEAQISAGLQQVSLENRDHAAALDWSRPEVTLPQYLLRFGISATEDDYDDIPF